MKLKLILTLVVILSTLSPIYGWRLQAFGNYLFDNTVFDRQTYKLSVSNITALKGELAGDMIFERSYMRAPFGGLSNFEDEFLTIGVDYLFRNTDNFGGLKLDAGRNVASGKTRYFLSGEIPLKFALPLPGTRLIATTGYRGGVVSDHPVAKRIGVSKQSVSLDVGLGVFNWELHGSYQYEWVASVSRDQYQALLSDTAFFKVFYDILNPSQGWIEAQTNPIPANTMYQISTYFFGPVTPSLYIGGSFSYSDAAHDNYLPLAETDSGDIVFAYFPYTTPHREGVFGLVTQYIHHTDASHVILNDVSLKLNIPVYSFGTYRGYKIGGNIIAGIWDYYYPDYGKGALCVEAKIGKLLPAGVNLSFSYTFVSKPYVAYHYFGADSYRYHTVSLQLEKNF